MSSDRNQSSDGSLEEEPGRGLFGNIRFWGGIGAGGLLVLFLLQNLQTVEVNFLWFSYDVRMVFALLLAAALGAITFFFLGVMRRRARRKERREDRRN
jgi:uncharacterized integral membrane protein